MRRLRAPVLSESTSSTVNGCPCEKPMCDNLVLGYVDPNIICAWYACAGCMVACWTTCL